MIIKKKNNIITSASIVSGAPSQQAIVWLPISIWLPCLTQEPDPRRDPEDPGNLWNQVVRLVTSQGGWADDLLISNDFKIAAKSQTGYSDISEKLKLCSHSTKGRYYIYMMLPFNVYERIPKPPVPEVEIL